MYFLGQISAVDTQHSRHMWSQGDGIKERQALPDWLVVYYFPQEIGEGCMCAILMGSFL